jgi:hypothetical protein
VEDKIIPVDPFTANPIWLDAGKYKPVVKFDRKLSDGVVTEPACNVIVVPLEVAVCAL